jgi:hypothetical protein
MVVFYNSLSIEFWDAIFIQEEDLGRKIGDHASTNTENLWLKIVVQKISYH